MDQPERPSVGSKCLSGPLQFTPTVADMNALVRRAKRHPLGIEFLLTGELGSVAATFHAHAFTVIAARERLAKAES